MSIWKPTYQPELYHHGVKGMKWGRHIFGTITAVAGPGGGGSADIDEELKEALEKLKKGEITPAQFKALKDKIAAKKEMAAKKEAQGSSVDTDAMERKYLAEGRDRYRKNGRYRNMNLTDVYGENAKENNHAGRDGANIYKQIDVSNERDGMNYSTREQDKSKYNDGKYRTRDKIREKITGVADPDHLKDTYNSYVRDFERKATQTQAYSVGQEEQYVRNQAKNYTDKVEKSIRDKSVTALINKVTGRSRSTSGVNSSGSTKLSTLLNNRPRSRKRNQSAGGTGVQLRELISNRPKSRKRNKSTGGTGIKLRGPVKKGGK